MAIKFYRLFISPFLGTNCRFSPSCSKYAFLAFCRFGVMKGSYLSFRRIIRCHPFHPGGLDPVPTKRV